MIVRRMLSRRCFGDGRRPPTLSTTRVHWRRLCRIVMVAVALGGVSPSAVHAASLWWSGAGTWDTTAQNWGTVSGGPYDAAVWNNAAPDTATFEGTSGTVTLGAPVTAGSLTFSTSGYVITGGTLTLAGSRQISVGSGVAATIDSAWAGTGSTTGITGSGTLTIGSSMSIGTLAAESTLIVAGGTVTAALGRLAGTPTPIAGRLQINSGGRFDNATNAFHVFGLPTPTTHPGIWINGGTVAASGGAFYVPSGTSTSSPGVTMTAGRLEGADVRLDGILGGQPTAYIQSLASSGTAVIAAGLRSYGGGTQRYDVADGAAAIDLQVTGTIGVFTSGTTSVVKSGAGLMEFTADQGFAGGLTVTSGTVWGRTAGALGTGTVTLGDSSTGSSALGLFISGNSSSVTAANPVVVSSSGSGTVTIGGQSTSSSVANIFSGAISLGRDVRLQAGNTGTRTTFTGSMTGAGSVTVTQGRVTFETTGKTYAGTTTVNSGAILQLTGAELLPDATALTVNGSLYLTSGGATTETIGPLTGNGTIQSHPQVTGTYTLAVNQATNTTFSGQIINGKADSTVALRKSGSGTLTLSGASSYSGGTTISAGILDLNAASSAGGGTITIGDSNTGGSDSGLFIAANSTVTVANPIVVSSSGSGLVDIGGRGTGVVVNTYSGAITLGRDVRLQAGSTAARTTFTGSMTGAGGVTVTQGRVTFETTAKTYAGATTVNPGAILQLTGGELLPDATAVTMNGFLYFGGGGTTTETIGSLTGSGTIQTHPEVTGTYTLAVDQATDTTFSGVIRNGPGTVSLTKSGGGTLTLSGSNSFSGSTAVSGGVLRIGAGGTTGWLPNSPLSVGSGAVLAFNRSDNYGGGFSGLISGSGGVRVDSGFLNLTAANDYTGATNVLAGGTLSVNGMLGGGGLTIASGAALMGSGTIGGLTTIAGMHMPGNSPGVETFTNLTYNSGASVQWELWGNTTANSPLAFDQIAVGGDLTFSGATTLALVFTGSASAVAWSDPFWGTNQEWLLYDVAGTTAGFGNLTLSTDNWQDSTGAFFQNVRPDGLFSVEQRGSDVYIVYAAVPEPTGLALAGIGTTLVAWGALRRQSRRRRVEGR